MRSGLSRILIAVVMATLLPVIADAQPVLSVVPTIVQTQGNVGTNAASKTVQVSNAGTQAMKWTVNRTGTASWLSVSPNKGTNSGTLVLTFQTANLTANTYQTSFRVEIAGGAFQTVNVEARIDPAVSTPLTVSCPANITTVSSTGSPVVVNYTATTSGGQQPVTVTGSPASGSSFPVGTTAVSVTAQSTDNQKASCGFSVTVTPPSGTSPDGTTTPPASSIIDAAGATWTVATDRRILRNNVQAAGGVGDLILWKNATIYVNNRVYPDANGSWWQWVGDNWTQVPDPTGGAVPPPQSTAIGPQPTITCPSNAFVIMPGQSVPFVVTSQAAGTTYCLKAGVHPLDRSITPKTGDVFIGEYGAILDGSQWSTNDDTEGAFRSHNQDIDNVTIRNLVIRNMARRGIHAYYTGSQGWLIENNEITASGSALVFPSLTTVRNNYIHHNLSGGYIGAVADNSVFENNEVAFNGWEQKITVSANVVIRNNFIHHNSGDGIWFDGSNTNALIEGNRVEDNGQFGIFYEISSGATIKNNIISRNRDTGIFISTSKNVLIQNNTIANNFRGITYFLNCTAVGGGGSVNYDLADNSAHSNAITVGTQTDAFATVFSWTLCDPSWLPAYMDPANKKLKFFDNTYDVPNVGGRYWFWNALKFWNEWLAIPQDAGSTVQ